MQIFIHPRFDKNYRKLNHSLRTKAKEREAIFIANRFTPSLETHKLHGKDRDYWAYSINNKYRIKFLFLDNGDILYLDVDTHDEVY